ncbi:MAG: hypothetical protein ABFS38_17315 [Bacteroidota bacterium]
MPGKVHILLFLITLTIPGIVDSQQPAEPGHHAEELLFRDEASEVPIAFYESHMELISHPINLNRVTSDQLGESGLFTPFQVHVLIKYREEFGELYSIYELGELRGFRISRLRKIAAYLTVETAVRFNPEKPGHHMILINVGRTLPEAIGYQSRQEGREAPAYAGSPIKTSIRIKTHVGRNLSMGLSYQKDAGEKWFQEMQPEFISGYIRYHGYRLLKQLVVGNFQLHHGLGLVNGTGFLHSPEGIQINQNSISKLKPYASLNEYRFEQGIGCRIDLNKIELLAWSSYQKLDLSMSDIMENPGNPDWLEHHRKTGLHRTLTEVGGRSLAFQVHSGIQAVFRHENLVVGSMFGLEVTGLTQKGMDSLKVDMEPNLNGISSLHAQWHRERLDLFGEIAMGKIPSTAILAGLKYHYNDFIQGIILYHHYGPSYRGFRPSSYASGSGISNEQGIAVGLHAEPGLLFTADLLLEYFNYPDPRYLTRVPSTGYRYSCTLNNPGIKHLQWRFRILKKVWQTTPATNATGLRSLKQSEVTRLDFRFIYDPEVMVKWQSRLVVSLLSGESKPIPGYAAVQQLSIHRLQSLTCTFQFVVFNVTDWDNRIYIYEPGLYYSFNFPVCYGTGQKVTSVVSLKTGRRITLAGKASMVTYHDRRETGSGNDLIRDYKKIEVGVQLRLSL